MCRGLAILVDSFFARQEGKSSICFWLLDKLGSSDFEGFINTVDKSYEMIVLLWNLVVI
jgi:hypothetical protein